MIEELPPDPVQVHSPGWRSLAHWVVARFAEVPVIIREERDGLQVRCDLERLPAARRRLLRRVIRACHETARQTCQVCGSRHAVTALGIGAHRLCPRHRGLAPGEGAGMPGQLPDAPVTAPPAVVAGSGQGPAFAERRAE